MKHLTAHVEQSYLHMFNNPTCTCWKFLPAHVEQSYLHMFNNPTCTRWTILPAHVEQSYLHMLNNPTCTCWTIQPAHVEQSYLHTLNNPTCTRWTILPAHVGSCNEGDPDTRHAPPSWGSCIAAGSSQTPPLWSLASRARIPRIPIRELPFEDSP